MIAALLEYLQHVTKLEISRTFIVSVISSIFRAALEPAPNEIRVWWLPLISCPFGRLSDFVPDRLDLAKDHHVGREGNTRQRRGQRRCDGEAVSGGFSNSAPTGDV